MGCRIKTAILVAFLAVLQLFNTARCASQFQSQTPLTRQSNSRNVNSIDARWRPACGEFPEEELLTSSTATTTTTHTRLLTLRGGKKKKTEPEVEVEIEVEESSEEGEFEFNEQDDEGADGEGVMKADMRDRLGSVNDMWVKTPPITQLYLAGSFIITILSFALNKNVWPEMLHFEWKAILTGQVWRLGTAFLFFGPLDPFYPLTMQFVWQHMSQLEKMNYNKPQDFIMMLGFGAVSLISVYSFLGISMKFLGHNLATYLVYIWSRVFEGMDVNFMDLVTLKSEMIPWFFCAQTFLLEKEIPFADMIGILVGHAYTYLREKKKLEAPAMLVAHFDNEATRQRYARFKNDFE